MLAAWVLFPLVMGIVCLGCGLLLEAVAGARLPRPLLLPAGLALVVVIAQLCIGWSVTVSLATPAVVAAAVLGIALGRPWQRELRGVPWGLLAAVAVFAAFGAPVLASGQATFAGYTKLDDTATWLALTDHAMAHGASTAHLPASTYGATLASYLHSGYPLGAFLPLGVGHKLTGQDIAWLVQPYMAFMAAMLALCLYWVAERAVGSRLAAALCAFAAAQAATLYGYSLWGGVKEVAAAWLVATCAALAADAAREARTGRAILPLAVVVAAVLAALSVGGLVWIGPSLAGALLLALKLQRRDVPLRQVALLAPAAAALAVPAIGNAATFLKPARGVLTASTELGNLRKPLDPAQVLGIWPAGDFRTSTVHPTATGVLLAVLVTCAVLGLGLAWGRRAWELPLYTVGTGLACLIVAAFGSPWVDGKAFATASPAFVLAGMVGAVLVLASRSLLMRGLGLALGAAILGGVLWSNALAYRDVDLAPRPQLAEIEQIGKRFAGQGPTLLNDYDPYAARHFLRSEDAESVSELRVHVIPQRDRSQVPKGFSADLDRFPVSSLLPYRTIVLHRSPAESRPPAGYALVLRGRYWDVWQRPARGVPRIVGDLPLGSGFAPGAVPGCSAVQRLGRQVPAGGALVAAARTPPVAINFATLQPPGGWLSDPTHAGALYPAGPGTLNASVFVLQPGDYKIWLGGTSKSRVRVYVDGRLAASARGVLQWEPFVKIGAVRLGSAGVHRVRVVYDGASLLHPGSGGFETGIGPLLLSRETQAPGTIRVAPSQAKQLCGRYLDWIEAVAPK